MHMHAQSFVIKIELDNQFNLKTCQFYKKIDLISLSLNLCNALYQIGSAKRIKIVLCVYTTQVVYDYGEPLLIVWCSLHSPKPFEYSYCFSFYTM